MITSNDATTSNGMTMTVEVNTTTDKDAAGYQVAARKIKKGKRARLSAEVSPIFTRRPPIIPVSEDGLRRNEMQTHNEIQTLQAKMTILEAKWLGIKAQRPQVAPITNNDEQDMQLDTDGIEQHLELQMDADGADTVFEAEFQAGLGNISAAVIAKNNWAIMHSEDEKLLLLQQLLLHKQKLAHTIALFKQKLLFRNSRENIFPTPAFKQFTNIDEIMSCNEEAVDRIRIGMLGRHYCQLFKEFDRKAIELKEQIPNYTNKLGEAFYKQLRRTTHNSRIPLTIREEQTTHQLSVVAPNDTRNTALPPLTRPIHTGNTVRPSVPPVRRNSPLPRPPQQNSKFTWWGADYRAALLRGNSQQHAAIPAPPIRPPAACPPPVNGGQQRSNTRHSIQFANKRPDTQHHDTHFRPMNNNKTNAAHNNFQHRNQSFRTCGDSISGGFRHALLPTPQQPYLNNNRIPSRNNNGQHRNQGFRTDGDALSVWSPPFVHLR